MIYGQKNGCNVPNQSSTGGLLWYRKSLDLKVNNKYINNIPGFSNSASIYKGNCFNVNITEDMIDFFFLKSLQLFAAKPLCHCYATQRISLNKWVEQKAKNSRNVRNMSCTEKSFEKG